MNERVPYPADRSHAFKAHILAQLCVLREPLIEHTDYEEVAALRCKAQQAQVPRMHDVEGA